jgi:hypothetical protein
MAFAGMTNTDGVPATLYDAAVTATEYGAVPATTHYGAVVPAQAGTQQLREAFLSVWITAFAGMTNTDGVVYGFRPEPQ